MATEQHSYLRRLAPAAYQGRAYVHWSMAIENRRQGWLDPAMHGRVRELLIHICARYAIAIPAYCLMPDHIHILAVGCDEDSDQRKAMALFRRNLTGVLPGGFALQRQAYDNVLRDADREHDAFQKTAGYILRNPERAGLVSEGDSVAYPYSGCVVAGYPDLDHRAEDYWMRFWRVYAHIVQAE